MFRERSGMAFAALALLMTLVVASTPAAAASDGSLNWGADSAPNAQYEVTATKAVHDMSWGASADAFRKYEDDSGAITKMEGEVNESATNPYSFVLSDANVSDWGAFPHDKSDVSALDAGEWSSTTSDSTNVSPSTSNVETAPGVDAVRLSTSGMGSGDTTTFTFSNISVTSDENKRFLQIVQDVSSLDSATSVEYRVVDEDGDYKIAELNQSRTSGDDFVTNATGDGLVYQVQLGTLTTQGSGDGTFDNIQKIEIVFADGNADLSIAGLNVEKMSTYDLGTEKKDTDSDDEFEDIQRTQKKTGGAISLSSLDTLGSAFQSATLHDVSAPMHFTGELATTTGDDAKLEQTEDESVDGGQYPGFKGTATVYVRLQLPDEYDLSFSGATLTDTQSVTSDRLMSVEYAEGVSMDTAFSDISDSSWTDISGSYSGDGTDVTVDDTVQVGSAGVLKYRMKLTPSQYDTLGDTGGGGGSGATGAGGWSTVPIVGTVLAAFVALIRKVGDS